MDQGKEENELPKKLEKGGLQVLKIGYEKHTKLKRVEKKRLILFVELSLREAFEKLFALSKYCFFGVDSKCGQIFVDFDK